MKYGIGPSINYMDKLKSYKQKWHFSINFFSVFLLVTFIPDVIGITPRLVIYPYWAVKGTLALLLIFNYKKKVYNLNLLEQLFVFTAFVYFINMFIDIFMQSYPIGIGSAFDLFSFLVSILIALSFRYDKDFCSNESFYTFIITLGIGLIIAFFLAQKSPPPLKGRFDANSTVNTINYGQMGCALCIIALYGLVNKTFKWSKLIFSLLFCLGALSIMKAGSRSPIVVLLVVTTIYTFARWGMLRGLLVSASLGLLVYLSLDFLVEIGQSVDSGLADRVVNALEKKETSGRDQIYANALRLFRESPLFGDFYLISSGIGRNGYPHNFFLEAFITTGLLGGIPFVIMTMIAFVKSYRLLLNGHKSSWIVLMFLQLLIYGMFSSALYSSQDFWALCLFVLSVPIKEEVRKKKRQRYPRESIAT
ncbi:O-antigen ligase family protein [Flavobacteriaceae bacterium TP-CH-4]|uniref:O-antigen ligase family protein n=1 Tax=Pelagihabitans pacificus TaxID=2696054 RepID=A0A967E877_9FLAO|nr:O-antigen ligase family protein [Pelagihabitans pacificus]NHF61380.1 O-antigen ligase family protein [Pelagihabitans pacificus]